MRQLEFLSKGVLAWREAPAPRLAGPKEALVRVFAVATCDLDPLIIRGEAPAAGPFAFGHEGVAEVVEVGEAVANVRPGDVVSVPFQISCGDCDACRRGRTAHCVGVPRTSMYGLGPLSGADFGGFLSDWVRVPFADHMLVALPAGVDPIAVASLSDNIADAWRLVAPSLAAEPGAPVLVVGGASISIYATAIALALGAASVDYVGGGPHELSVAAQLGARVIEGPPPTRLGPYPITVNAGFGRECLHCAIRSTGPDGTCANAGMFFESITPMPLSEMYVKGMTFRTGRVHARDAMPEALALVCEGQFRPELATSHVVAWNDAAEALAEPGWSKMVITRARTGASG